MTNEWKPEKNISSPWDVDTWENNIGQPVKPSGDNLPYPYTAAMFDPKKLSNWTCYMFGAVPGDGIQWTPQEGRVPNRFVRWMMKLCFDCKWVKND